MIEKPCGAKQLLDLREAEIAGRIAHGGNDTFGKIMRRR
jgi:hypothetical protein